MDNKEELKEKLKKELIESLNNTFNEIEEERCNEPLTLSDIMAFKKVLYHLNHDVPELSTVKILEIVNELYDIKPSINMRTVELPLSDRRKRINEEHRKMLDSIAGISND